MAFVDVLVCTISLRDGTIFRLMANLHDIFLCILGGVDKWFLPTTSLRVFVLVSNVVARFLVQASDSFVVRLPVY